MSHTADFTPRRYRFTAVLGDDSPVIESVDPASLASLPADEVRDLFEQAGFVIVRMPGGGLSLEGEDSLEEEDQS